MKILSKISQTRNEYLMAYLSLLKEVWKYAEGHRWKIWLFFVLHTLSLSAMVLTPLVFAQILNAIQTEAIEQILKTVTFWTFIWVGMFLWFNLTHRVARYFEFNVAYNVKKTFQEKLYRIVTQLPLKWHADHHSGDTINRINIASEALFSFTVSQFFYLGTIINFVGPITVLSFLSWKISIGVAIFSVLIILSMKRFDQALVAAYSELNEKRHKVSAVFFDFVSNIKTIITLRLGNRTVSELSQKIDQTYRPLIYAETWVNSWKWFTLTFLIMILQLGVIFTYVWQKIIENSTILIGNVAAVFQYVRQLTDGFNQGVQHYQEIVSYHTNFRAVDSIMALSDTLRVNADNSLKIYWTEVQIDNLSFSYSPSKPTLQNIQFTFRKSEKIALVGESGSGKSSLMALMRGLYEPETASIRIDGKTYDDLSPFFAITTLIPQEPEVFENSVRYNITVGLEYSDADIQESLRLSRFDSVLKRLPHGLDTDVREKGVTLSGGEKQRLALARGILAAQGSDIILMDEPTSSIDSYNELEIYDNVFSHFKEQTIISSVHRLHLLNKFDRILVMSEGKIVQDGKLDDLINTDGPFKSVWNKYTAGTLL